KAGAEIKGLALASALWCRYCCGETESGTKTAPNDPRWTRLQQAARQARDNPLAFLDMRDIFGEAAQHPVYRAAFSDAVSKLWAQGVRAILADYLGGRL